MPRSTPLTEPTEPTGSTEPTEPTEPAGHGPRRLSFVTGCQQLLALGVVVAALTPAASVVSLDVVNESPSAGGTPADGAIRGDLAAYTRAAARPARVPAQVVDPTVDEY